MRCFTNCPSARFVVAGCVALFTGAAVWSGCDRSSQSSAPRRAVIVVSGDTAGWIVPCGCTANQSGGLLRRGTYLSQLRAGNDVLYLDAGGAGAGNSPYQQAKLQAIFAGETAMGVAAHNLGASELSLRPAALRKAASAADIPLLSANTTDLAGQPLAPGIRIFPFGGKRIAVTGVVSPRFATSQITITRPAQAIADTLAAHKGEYDSLIVLAYMPEQELQALAAAMPEADAVIGGPTGQSIVPHLLGPVLLGSATNKGKFLVRIDLPFGQAASAAWSGQIVQLDQNYADDPTQQANLQAYLQQLRHRDFTADDSGFIAPLPAGAPADYRIAGNASCTACHSADAMIWAHSLHAIAGDSLKPRHFDVDPDCLRCHTTGYGLPGGFVSPRRTPQFYGVGCEDCHGPSQTHVADPHVHTQYLAF
ncbi:MAG TPA: multiheme c-type cytochrome, partial [Tepidisphaeraceae bacterium]|nr:multiheme c-type cytochrome [Tepidisphaeraceae bacterium]